MVSFDNINELITFINEDNLSKSLNPIRFIFINNLSEWTVINKELSKMVNNYIYLSEYCIGNDTTPNLLKLYAQIRTAKYSSILLPLSEYFRFIDNNTIYSIIRKLVNLSFGKSDNKLRIYIPLYQYSHIIPVMNNQDPRQKSCFLSIKSAINKNYTLTVVHPTICTHKQNIISGFRKYLQYWEQNPSDDMILMSKNVEYWKNSVISSDLNIISSSYDLIKYTYSLSTIVKENDGSSSQWQWLAQLFYENDTFDSLCSRYFHVSNYNYRLFENWMKYNSEEKWLLWLWAKSNLNNDYTSICIKDTHSYIEFLDNLYEYIIPYIHVDKFEQYYTERKLLLQSTLSSPPKEYLDRLRNLNGKDSLSILTNLTIIEKQEIFLRLSHLYDEYRKQDSICKILQKVYPELAGYMKVYDFISDNFPHEINKYFSDYRWCKVTNSIDQSFIKAVNKFAAEHGKTVFQLKSRNSIVSEEYNENSSIYFVDGMGVEYLGYLSYKLKNLLDDNYKIKYRVGYCNLPSTTKINRDFILDKRVCGDTRGLDEMKHGSSLYPQTIINEFHFIDTIIQDIVSCLKSGIQKIILTSDHGTSRLAVLARKSIYGHNIYKYGRFCDNADFDQEIPGTIEYEDKLIFANYGRFEQRGAPIDEIHGGASLEEWLVPIISIEKIHKNIKIAEIIGPSSSIKLHYDSIQKKTLGTVRFKIKGYDNNDVFVQYDNNKVPCTFKSGYYTFQYIKGTNKSSINVLVCCNNQKIGEFNFKISGGLEKNSKFDI